MLINRFKKAVRRMTGPGEPVRMRTNGFEADTLSGEFYRIANAVRTDNGTYDVNILENNEPVNPGDKRQFTGLSLREALDVLDEWERRCSRTDRPYSLGSEDTPYFRDVAEAHGIKLRPDSASLRNAGRIKLVAVAKRKAAPRR